MRSQQQRTITRPLSRAKKTKKIPIAAIILAVIGLFGIAGLLYFVSLQSQAKRQNLRRKSLNTVDAVGNHEEPVVDKIKEEEKQKDATEQIADDHADAVVDAADAANVVDDTGAATILVLTTNLGLIRMILRPDLSLESTKYLTELANAESCSRCNFYRAEKPGILQGIMDHATAETKVERGPCPPEYADGKQPDCPKWDPQCGCHGPIMHRGMVGWAGGATGPDFFIDTYKAPAKFWGTQHTVFAEIKDEESLALIDRIYELPVTKKGGMTFIDEKIHFTVSLEDNKR